jgi:hypothetical protein
MGRVGPVGSRSPKAPMGPIGSMGPVDPVDPVIIMGLVAVDPASRVGPEVWLREAPSAPDVNVTHLAKPRALSLDALQSPVWHLAGFTAGVT